MAKTYHQRPSPMQPAIDLLKIWVEKYKALEPIYHDMAQNDGDFCYAMNTCYANRTAFEKAVAILEGKTVQFP